MLQSLVDFFDRIGGDRRVLMLLMGLGAAAVIWGFAKWATAPVWIPLFQNLPVESVASLTERLTEEGIESRLEMGGSSLLVPRSEVARARVALAQEGFPASGRPGFELFDEPSWGMTDFTQRVNYRRALEGELERTISRMRGVERAQVHLALRQSSVLRRNEQPGEASVVLGVRSGVQPENAVVEGIASLVASAVEGLESANVRVLDDSGRLLSANSIAGSPEGLSDRQLQIQRDVETYLEQRAEALVSRMVGPGNATVRVSAALNFDRIDRTVQAVDPDQQATVQEDRAEIIPGTEEQGASSITTNSVFENTRSVETFSRGGARLDRLTVAVLVNDVVIPADTAGGQASPTYEPRTQQQLDEVEELVANAVGLSNERGDQISVISVPIEVEPMPVQLADGPDIIGIIQALQRPAVGIFGALLALVLALRVMSTMKSLPAPERRRAIPAAPGAEPPRVTATQQATIPEVPVDASGMSEPRLREPQPLEVTDPELTARVVKAWMSEA